MIYEKIKIFIRKKKDAGKLKLLTLYIYHSLIILSFLHFRFKLKVLNTFL